jgi:hypothetical protein
MKNTEPSNSLRILALVSLPAVLLVSWLLTIPPDRFTQRSWESLFLAPTRTAPFLPLQSLERWEKGDLAFHLVDAEKRKIRFETDEWGYRNTQPPCADPEAVVIGDSMAVGGSQEETPSAQLSRLSGKCVRSFAGGSISYALNSIFGLGLKPRFVILILTQRSAGGVREFPDPARPGWGAHRLPWLQAVYRFWLQSRKNLYWNFRAKHGVYEAVTRIFRPESTPAHAPGVSSGRILFYEGDWGRRVDSSGMQRDLENLEVLRKNLEKQGARLIYTFVPNKSTIYPGPFTDRDPDFVDRFRPKAMAMGHDFIDLFHPFRERWKQGLLSHYAEDSHWNAEGVRVFCEGVLSNMHPDQTGPAGGNP